MTQLAIGAQRHALESQRGALLLRSRPRSWRPRWPWPSKGLAGETLKYVIGRANEFEDRGRRIVRVGGREIGVFRFGERFFAVRNRCPHQGGPLCAGRVFPLMVADAPGAVRLEDQMLISCPWHGWQYDLETGNAYVQDDPHVRSYDVRVQHGRELTESGEEPAYVVETFSVSIEDDYVVIDA